MRAILAVSTNTFRQVVRERLFVNVILFGLGMLLLAMVVGSLTLGYPDRNVRSIGLSGVSIALDLISLLLAVNLIFKEIDRKTLFVVLTRPVRRWQYVLGRYLGLMGALCIALIGLSIAYTGALTAAFGSLKSTDVLALAMCLPEAAILAGVGLVLSAFSTPTVGAGMGLGLWLAAATTDDLVRLTAKSSGPMQFFAKATYYALPNLERFNLREVAVHDLTITAGEVVFICAYGLCYSIALVAVASLILQRREMV